MVKQKTCQSVLSTRRCHHRAGPCLHAKLVLEKRKAIHSYMRLHQWKIMGVWSYHVPLSTHHPIPKHLFCSLPVLPIAHKSNLSQPAMRKSHCSLGKGSQNPFHHCRVNTRRCQQLKALEQGKNTSVRQN